MDNTKEIIQELRKRVPEVRANLLSYFETGRQRHYRSQLATHETALRQVEESNWPEARKRRAILQIQSNIGRAKALLEEASTKEKRKEDTITAFQDYPARFFWDDQPPPPPPPAGIV